MQKIYCYAKKSTEFPERLYYINHISDKIKVRYFKPLVYKSKALVRMYRGFSVCSPNRACPSEG